MHQDLEKGKPTPQPSNHPEYKSVNKSVTRTRMILCDMMATTEYLPTNVLSLLHDPEVQSRRDLAGNSLFSK